MIPAEWKGRGSLFYFEGGATTNLVEGKEGSLSWVAWNRISLGRIKWNSITGWFIVHCHSFSSKARPDQVRWHIHRNTRAIARNLGRRKEKTVICFWGTCCKHREKRSQSEYREAVVNCEGITPGAHHLEPPYQLYPWFNPLPYLVSMEDGSSG